MLKKILLLAIFALAVPAAQAQTTTTLNKSDEKFLSELPYDDFPGPEEMADKDGDGIADGSQKQIKPKLENEKKKSNVKYVYKPGSDTTLRRAIQDDRIEDGYVQDLMRQRSPRQ